MESIQVFVGKVNFLGAPGMKWQIVREVKLGLYAKADHPETLTFSENIIQDCNIH